MPTAREITSFAGAVDEENPWVQGGPSYDAVEIVEPDPGWSATYRRLAADLTAVLGPAAHSIEHVGSTSVPDLAAKPVIDIDLTVADPAQEERYIPLLIPLGYVHTLREPGWYGHRALRLEQPRVNLHVWGPDSPELVRHRLFRDWLATHPDDRRRYEAAKRVAIPGGGTVMDYNARKEPVIREIYGRIFVAAGLL